MHMGFSIYSMSAVVFIMLLLASEADTLLGSMQTSAECVYVFNKFSMAPLCSTCLSRGFWMWLCSAEKAFDEPCENACSTSVAAFSDIFVCVPFLFLKRWFTSKDTR